MRATVLHNTFTAMALTRAVVRYDFINSINGNLVHNIQSFHTIMISFVYVCPDTKMWDDLIVGTSNGILCTMKGFKNQRKKGKSVLYSK